MRVDVWSDVVCPWCWLGKARLDRALQAFPERASVEVVFRSFELDPGAEPALDVPTNELLARKYGLGPAQLAAMQERLGGLGAAEGLAFRFERARTSNTFEAHQLIHLAASHGKQEAMTDRLFRAQFNEGVRVGDRGELVQLAVAIGLDGSEAEAALDEQRFAAAVRADEADAKRLGVSGVPFFLVNGELALSGAQSVEVLGELLAQAAH
jgi:predicted DsbA family dithiol-disulfide isomerase